MGNHSRTKWQSLGNQDKLKKYPIILILIKKTEEKKFN